MWTRDAGLGTFPLTWIEALGFVRELNEQSRFGFKDWRLPNRAELFSLISHSAVNPALPDGHPFRNVFSGYYWSSTTCSRLPDQAWYIHLGGARVFKGMKHGSYMVWPVRNAPGEGLRVHRTGQRNCYAADGSVAACSGTGQDGEIRAGRPWPQPRFGYSGRAVMDRMTGLMWDSIADRTGAPVSWDDALAAARCANLHNLLGYEDWRLPGVRELESLCDMGTHSPALPEAHPFKHVRPCYWSGSTSRYDTRYAWTLYLDDGAVGVGFKPLAEFHVLLVRNAGADVQYQKAAASKS
ncbi:MAG: DUF1566 domain-containing protein [Desulfobacteraceae bacterium]|nr:MAG: DUF1566 domain-containing protein [Desulfobacteraceae bacterium]